MYVRAIGFGSVGTPVRLSQSGDFVVIKVSREEIGLMFVAVDDERHHHPPEGWSLVEIVEAPNGSMETYVYRRKNVRGLTVL